MEVVSDRKIAVDENTYDAITGDFVTASGDLVIDWFEADIVQYSDYYPYGMAMSGRNGSIAESYRYAFNGMETDGEVSGSGNSYTTQFRQYDPRLGRWKSLDPLKAQFPWQSPFIGMDDNPISLTDPFGLSTGIGEGEDTGEEGTSTVEPARDGGVLTVVEILVKEKDVDEKDPQQGVLYHPNHKNVTVMTPEMLNNLKKAGYNIGYEDEIPSHNTSSNSNFWFVRRDEASFRDHILTTQYERSFFLPHNIGANGENGVYITVEPKKTMITMEGGRPVQLISQQWGLTPGESGNEQSARDAEFPYIYNVLTYRLTGGSAGGGPITLTPQILMENIVSNNSFPAYGETPSQTLSLPGNSTVPLIITISIGPNDGSVEFQKSVALAERVKAQLLLDLGSSVGTNPIQVVIDNTAQKDEIKVKASIGLFVYPAAP